MAIAELSEPDADIRPGASRADELAALIRQQAADDASDVLRGSRWQVRECDLADPERSIFTLDALPDPRTARRRGRPDVEGGFYLIGLAVPWEAAVHDVVRSGACECPSCGDRPRWGQLCLVCDRCDLDGKADLPGLDIDAHPDLEYIRAYGLNATKHRRGKLAGGVGKTPIKPGRR